MPAGLLDGGGRKCQVRQLGFFGQIFSIFENWPFGKRLACGASWSLTGATANRLFYLVLSLVAARMLGKQVFGQFSFVQTTTGMLALLAGFGLGQAAAKHVAEFRCTDPCKAGRILTLCCVWTLAAGALGSLAMFLLAPWFAAQTGSDPTLTTMLRIGALLVLFGAVNGAQTGILTGLESFRTIAILAAASGVTTVATTAFGAWAGGAKGVIWGLNLGLAAATVLSSVAIKKAADAARIPLSLSRCSEELPVVWGFGAPVVVASAVVAPVYWYGQAVLAKDFGFSAQAEYSIAAQWRTAVSWLPAMLTSAYLPVLASLKPEEQRARSRLVLSGLGLSGGVSVIMAAGIALLSEVILSGYGGSFKAAVLPFQILAFAAVFDSLNDLINQSLLASGRPWLRLVSNLGWAMVTVIGISLIVPSMGVVGFAMVLFVTQGLHLGLQMLFYRAISRTDRST